MCMSVSTCQCRQHAGVIDRVMTTNDSKLLCYSPQQGLPGGMINAAEVQYGAAGTSWVQTPAVLYV